MANDDRPTEPHAPQPGGPAAPPPSGEPNPYPAAEAGRPAEAAEEAPAS